MYISKGNKKVKVKTCSGWYLFVKILKHHTASFETVFKLTNNYKKMHHHPMKRKYKKRKKRIEIGEIFV